MLIKKQDKYFRTLISKIFIRLQFRSFLQIIRMTPYFGQLDINAKNLLPE